MTKFLKNKMLTALSAIGLGLLVSCPALSETITVTHWGSTFYGAPYAVAKEKGFFKKRGVDITGFLSSSGGGTSVRNMLASDLPFGEVASSAALLAIAAGQPIRIIGGGAQTVEDITWISQPGSKLEKPADLVGKTLAYTRPGSITDMLFRICLKNAGIGLGQVKLVAGGDNGANLASVMNGTVAVSMISEPLWTEYKSKLRSLDWSKDCIDYGMAQTVMITTAEFARTNGDKLRAILAARDEGVSYLLAHPDEAAEIVAKTYKGDPALYKEMFKHFIEISFFTPSPLHPEKLERMIDAMMLVDQLKSKPILTGIIDNSFVPK